MRANWLITALVILVSVSAKSQKSSASRVFPGTNLRIQLNDNFIPSKTMPGFNHVVDSTVIFALQSNSDILLDQIIEEQQRNLMMTGGSIIKKVEKFKHYGLDAATIDYDLTNSNYEGVTFLFSRQGSQFIVGSFFPKGKREEVIKILFTVKIDEAMEFKKDSGFTSMEKSGPFVKIKNNTMEIDYEHRDNNKEVVGTLNLKKLAKGDFSDGQEFLESLTSQFFSKLTVVVDQSFESLKGSISHKRIFKGTRKDGSTKYIYLLVRELENNFVIASGSPNVLDDAKYLDEILKSVREE